MSKARDVSRLFSKTGSSSSDVGSSVSLSDNPPASAAAGDTWFNTTNLKTYIYYDDGTSTQWTPATPMISGPAGPAGPSANLSAIAEDILPDADSSRSLGSASKKWKDLFLSGDTISLGGIKLKDAGGSLKVETSAGADVSPGGIKIYANLAAFPSSGNTAGDMAFATDTKAVYVWDGVEWDRMYTDANAVPEWTTAPPATANLASDGTATNQTVVASDPEGFPIEYSYDTNPSNQAQATISNTAGAFTITPSTTEADAGDFILRYKATDGLHTTSRSTTYTLAFYTNADIANASNDNDTFNFTSQEQNARGITFKPDGTKMYMTGYSSDSVHQYSLSTPWLVSSATYDSVSFNHKAVCSEDTVRDLVFKPDGTKLYICGSGGDRVYEFDLSSAWDLSTTTYSSVNLAVNSQNSTPTGLALSADGLRVFIIGSTVPDAVHQYDLSTAWDLSTATYNNVNFVVSTQEAVPLSMLFNPDGTKMYVCGTQDKVFEYDLSTGFDVSTAAYNNVFASISADPAGMALSTDGRKMYFLNYSNDTVYTYSV